MFARSFGLSPDNLREFQAFLCFKSVTNKSFALKSIRNKITIKSWPGQGVANDDVWVVFILQTKLGVARNTFEVDEWNHK
jgi:hypothetical protein